MSRRLFDRHIAVKVHLSLVRNVSLGDSTGAGTGDGGLTGTAETILAGDTLNTVGGVDVLNEGKLPAGSTTLAGGDGGVSQEVFPDLEVVIR